MPRSLLIFLALFILATTTLSLVPTTSLHAGLIPCGLSSPDPDIPGGGTERCTLCHLLVGLSRIVVFLRNIMAAVAVAVLVAMAIIYLTSGGNEGRMTFAKGGMFAALIGLGIVLLAWVTVNFILTLPIFNTSTNLIRTGWDTVQCSTTSYSTGATASMAPITSGTGNGGGGGTGGGNGGTGSAVTIPRDLSGNPISAPALPSPTGLTASAPSTEAINVTWTAVPGATGYLVERCTGLSCTTFTTLGTTTGTSFSDTGLASGTGYSYHVQAVSAAGVSGWTNVVSATTQGVPSNPYVYVPPPDDPYGMAGGGGSGAGGGGGTNYCSAGVQGDTASAGHGFGSGTFRPSGMTNVWVVDQSGTPNGAGGFTAFPGCVNGGFPAFNCPDTGPGGFTMDIGHIAAIRFIAGSIPATGQNFILNAGTGSGIPSAVTMSLSTMPGDFSSIPAACKSTAPAGGVPRITVGGTGCSVISGSLYYLNVRTDSTCSGGTCRFYLQEPSGMQGTTVSC